MTDAEKKAAEKKAAEKKAAEKKAAEKKAAEKKAAEKKAAEKAAGKGAKYAGKEIKVKLSGGEEFEGLCTSERKINGGAQVWLKLKGQVSRYFNVEDIAE